MDSRAKALISQGDSLFTQKLTLISLWQEMAEHFYPERADFTVNRYLGEEFAGNLMTSYPLLVRRELGSSFSAMLRPTQKDWFKTSILRDDKLDNDARAWLEDKTKVQKRAMYDPVTNFIRATKEGDHDFATFGQTVISTELNRNRDALLYKCRHLRDVAWAENSEGHVDNIHDKHKMTARDLIKTFKGVPGATIHPKVTEAMSKDPFRKFLVRRIIIPSEDYDTGTGPNNKRFEEPFVSVYVDVENNHVIEETGQWTKVYTIARWQTVSGSQYAFSPATVAGLPDGRLLQDMTRILLEAGEKATNPPMIAKEDVVRSDISIYAGGVTWTDPEYDERLGASMRPITNDYSGIPLGIDLRNDVKETLKEAFYLNKLSLPPAGGPDMTAYEVGQRVQDYIRQALPLFEPMEMDYNGSICMDSFTILQRAGFMGSVYDMPKSLQGEDVSFNFESPLHDAVERQKGNVFMETKAMIAEAAALDPGAASIIKTKTTIRDVLTGIGTPAKWLHSEAEMEEKDQEQAQKESVQETLNTMMQGAETAEQVGKAGEALKSVQGPVG